MSWMMAHTYKMIISVVWLALVMMETDGQEIVLGYKFQPASGPSFFLHFTRNALVDFRSCRCQNKTRSCDIYYQSNGLVSRIETIPFNPESVNIHNVSGNYVCRRVENEKYIRCERTDLACKQLTHCADVVVNGDQALCELGQVAFGWEEGLQCSVLYLGDVIYNGTGCDSCHLPVIWNGSTTSGLTVEVTTTSSGTRGRDTTARTAKTGKASTVPLQTRGPNTREMQRREVILLTTQTRRTNSSMTEEREVTSPTTETRETSSLPTMSQTTHESDTSAAAVRANKTTMKTTEAKETKVPKTQTLEEIIPVTHTKETTNPVMQIREITSPTSHSRKTTSSAMQTPETTNPTLQTPETTNPTLQTPETTNPTLQTPETTNPTLQTPETTNPTLQTPETTSPAMQTRETTSPAMQTRETTSPVMHTEQTLFSTTQTRVIVSKTAQLQEKSILTTQRGATTNLMEQKREAIDSAAQAARQRIKDIPRKTVTSSAETTLANEPMNSDVHERASASDSDSHLVKMIIIASVVILTILLCVTLIIYIVLRRRKHAGASNSHSVLFTSTTSQTTALPNETEIVELAEDGSNHVFLCTNVYNVHRDASRKNDGYENIQGSFQTDTNNRSIALRETDHVKPARVGFSNDVSGHFQLDDSIREEHIYTSLDSSSEQLPSCILNTVPKTKDHVTNDKTTPKQFFACRLSLYDQLDFGDGNKDEHQYVSFGDSLNHIPKSTICSALNQERIVEFHQTTPKTVSLQSNLYEQLNLRDIKKDQSGTSKQALASRSSTALNPKGAVKYQRTIPKVVDDHSNLHSKRTSEHNKKHQVFGPKNSSKHITSSSRDTVSNQTHVEVHQETTPKQPLALHSNPRYQVAHKDRHTKKRLYTAFIGPSQETATSSTKTAPKRNEAVDNHETNPKQAVGARSNVYDQLDLEEENRPEHPYTSLNGSSIQTITKNIRTNHNQRKVTANQSTSPKHLFDSHLNPYNPLGLRDGHRTGRLYTHLKGNSNWTIINSLQTNPNQREEADNHATAPKQLVGDRSVHSDQLKLGNRSEHRHTDFKGALKQTNESSTKTGDSIENTETSPKQRSAVRSDLYDQLQVGHGQREEHLYTEFNVSSVQTGVTVEDHNARGSASAPNPSAPAETCTSRDNSNLYNNSTSDSIIHTNSTKITEV